MAVKYSDTFYGARHRDRGCLPADALLVLHRKSPGTVALVMPLKSGKPSPDYKDENRLFVALRRE
jgi:hypothetical protein